MIPAGRAAHFYARFSLLCSGERASPDSCDRLSVTGCVIPRREAGNEIRKLEIVFEGPVRLHFVLRRLGGGQRAVVDLVLPNV